MINFLTSFLGSTEKPKDLKGKFYKIHPRMDICIFNNSSISIEKTTIQYNSELCIQRVYEEGEEEGMFFTLNIADFDDNEYRFLIDAILNLQFTQKGFVFNKDDMQYRFEIEESDIQQDKNFFERCVRCCFERQFQKDVDVSVDELFSWYETTTKTLVKSPALPQVTKVTFKGKAKLFYFDPSDALFKLQDDNVNVTIYEKSEFSFCLKVENQTIYEDSEINSSLNSNIINKERSFIWNKEINGKFWSLSLKFDDDFEEFLNKFSVSMYENRNKELFSKTKEEDKDYLMKGYAEDVSMDESNSERETESEDDEEKGEEEEKDESFVSADEGETEATESSNKILEVGYKHDRSFVVRGNQVGVFKHNDDKLEFQTTIKNIQTISGKSFDPSKLMLHEEDSSFLLLNPNENDKIFKMDIERGKVIEEWTVGEDIPVNNILPESKYAQMTPSKTFVGFNKGSLFRVDPRLSTPSKKAESMNYSSKVNFSAATTTGSGELAMANDKGEIRLYNKLDKRAKTAFPGLGDEIIAIDSTENGRYLLATCSSFLLVVDTLNQETGVSGYSKSLGKNKNKPIRLQLKPEHAIHMGKVCFTPAKFNVGEKEEKTIVTSTGRFVITWNFRRVKAGKTTDYQIKEYSDVIVSDQFKYNNDRSIIVTLPHNVTMAAKSSFSTPKKLRNLRDEIVNSPF
ncbi:VID27-domain-containing protein [Rozella allomycis CSF55]|uniref:VID27-domain-containing protein n=1 Tax=Rozella allomycis (strain CSF55) TaxID=988480 RepID=A0A4V1J0B8_ROZAC|nr:VID27-domain-containing protein [Rozella allomycis CSF55]